jgi:hypothetical protein
VDSAWGTADPHLCATSGGAVDAPTDCGLDDDALGAQAGTGCASAGNVHVLEEARRPPVSELFSLQTFRFDRMLLA